MIYTKFTHGYMLQVFDTVRGGFVSQEFVVGDDSQWEEEQGEPIDHPWWDEDQFGPNGPYHPYPKEELKWTTIDLSPRTTEALREAKVEELVDNDIRNLTRDLAEGDRSYLTNILTGEGWTQYSKMTDEQINEEYENLQEMTNVK